MLSHRNESNKREQKNKKDSHSSIKNTSKSFKENKAEVVSRKNKQNFLKSDSIRSFFNTKMHLQQETSKIMQNYLPTMIDSELSKSNSNFREDFLQSHQISAEVRARMVLLKG